MGFMADFVKGVPCSGIWSWKRVLTSGLWCRQGGLAAVPPLRGRAGACEGTMAFRVVLSPPP